MKLNLGCGSKIIDGYVNVESCDYFEADKSCDLEKFPYPFKDDSVDEILMSHTLERLGQNPDTFNRVIKELYRICKNNAIINIHVLHFRHDSFASNPMNVRPITPLGLSFYDKAANEEWARMGSTNSPLALINNVNFKVENVNYVIEDKFVEKFNSGEIDEQQLHYHMEHFNNVIKQIDIKWRVLK